MWREIACRREFQAPQVVERLEKLRVVGYARALAAWQQQRDVRTLTRRARSRGRYLEEVPASRSTTQRP